MTRLSRWFWKKVERETQPDWQTLVDNVALAAGIYWQKDPNRWVIYGPLAAKVISNHFHAAIDNGNLNPDAVDGELFALDAALEMYGG